MSAARSQPSLLPGGVAAQHRHLADEISQLERALAAGDDWDQASALLDQLLADLGSHFAHEEELMEQGGYPALNGHRSEHEAFLARVRAMRARCDEHRSELMLVLAEMLHAWFVKHEASSDRRAAEFLQLDEW